MHGICSLQSAGFTLLHPQAARPAVEGASSLNASQLAVLPLPLLPLSLPPLPPLPPHCLAQLRPRRQTSPVTEPRPETTAKGPRNRVLQSCARAGMQDCSRHSSHHKAEHNPQPVPSAPLQCLSPCHPKHPAHLRVLARMRLCMRPQLRQLHPLGFHHLILVYLHRPGVAIQPAAGDGGERAPGLVRAACNDACCGSTCSSHMLHSSHQWSPALVPACAGCTCSPPHHKARPTGSSAPAPRRGRRPRAARGGAWAQAAPSAAPPRPQCPAPLPGHAPRPAARRGRHGGPHPSQAAGIAMQSVLPSPLQPACSRAQLAHHHRTSSRPPWPTCR